MAAKAAWCISGPIAARVAGRAHAQLAHRGGEALEEGLVAFAGDQNAVGRAAVLAGGLELGVDGEFHRLLQVGVGQHDEGRVAAQFQRHFFHILGGGLQHQLADAGRAGEAHRAHAAVLYQGFHAHLRFAQHYVEDAGREPGFLGQLGQGEGRVGRLVGRLDHHRATGGQGGGGLAGDHRRGEVPGGQQCRHADRLHDGAQVGAGDVAGDVAAVQAPGLFGEPGDEAGGVVDLAPGLGQGLALFLGEHLRQVLAVPADQFGPAQQGRGALVQGQLAPGREGRGGGIHRGDYLLAFEQRYVADDLAAGRVFHGDAGAAGAMQPLAVDVAQRLEEEGVGVGHDGVSLQVAWESS
ncbi:hypothetical protein G039_0317965 [Pseudomonas aeruginosa VRFPA01]|nr:hypothetical protein G039_0317965 [Pseudomonas aeruginosa VRFPA01]